MSHDLRFAVNVYSGKTDFSDYEYRAETMDQARTIASKKQPCWAHGAEAVEDDFLDIVVELARIPGVEFVNVHASPMDESVECWNDDCCYIWNRKINTNCPRCGDPVPTWCDEPQYSIDGVRHLLIKANTILSNSGKRLYVENVRETPELMMRILEGLPSEIGFTLDVGHANVVIGSPIPFIDALSRRLCHLHLHDNHGGGRMSCDEHLTPGLGNIDWGHLAECLSNFGFQGTATFECIPPSAEWMARWAQSVLRPSN